MIYAVEAVAAVTGVPGEIVVAVSAVMSGLGGAVALVIRRLAVLHEQSDAKTEARAAEYFRLYLAQIAITDQQIAANDRLADAFDKLTGAFDRLTKAVKAKP